MEKKTILVRLILVILAMMMGYHSVNAQCNCVNNYIFYEDNDVWVHRHMDSTVAAVWLKSDLPPKDAFQTVEIDYGVYSISLTVFNHGNDKMFVLPMTRPMPEGIGYNGKYFDLTKAKCIFKK